MTSSQIFGPVVSDKGVRFSFWAPAVDMVSLRLEAGDRAAEYCMVPSPDGWHQVDVEGAKPGDRYRFVLTNGQCVPDPASRFNPEDVHGPSQVVDPSYPWQETDWGGRAWREAVVYELHVGAFTSEGTYDAARKRLLELKALGITAIELMPLADFPGKRNWGYDGVLPFAPDASYGTPAQLKQFIDEAHGAGIMVMLDVVYNHFGPEGNYLPVYCPQFFNPAHQTPWGAAINFDGACSRKVRDFYVQNALYWIEEFRFDGLRMDAVHAIRDDSSPTIIEEICKAVRQGPGAARHVHIVLENEDNRASLLTRSERGPKVATAQWNDDIHHAVHVLATGESEGYYADYQEAPVELFGRALAEGFIFQGQASTFLKGRCRGEPSAELPGTAFVSFLQTHDQVGNRALGERLHAIGDGKLIRAARACVLLSPQVPMFFMGEEYAASTRFQFFCDFGPQLASAVTEGRRKEFSHFGAFSCNADGTQVVPDPNAEQTFADSKLRWDERALHPHDGWLEEARTLLGVRHKHIVPLMVYHQRPGNFYASYAGGLWVEWIFADDCGPVVRLHLVAHLGKDSATIDVARPRGETIFSMDAQTDGALGLRLSRGAVYCSIEHVG